MSVVPIPGLDFGVDIKLMKDIIEDINKIYGLDQNKSILLVKMLKNVFYQAAIQGSSMIGEKVTSGALKLIIRDVAKRTAKTNKMVPSSGTSCFTSVTTL